MLAITLIVFGAGSVNWLLLTLAALHSAFSALGAFVSVAAREVFEAQTLANFIRFPMMFLGDVFVPMAALPPVLQIIAASIPRVSWPSLDWSIASAAAIDCLKRWVNPGGACLDLLM